MPTYYTFIPNSSITAEVLEAPEARKARTAFLDYLSRSGQIRYSDRGSVRKLVKSVKVDPGSTQASVVIDYRTGIPTENLKEEAPVSGAQEDNSRLEEDQAKEYPGGSPEDIEDPDMTAMPSPLGNSKIIQVSRNTGRSLFTGMQKLVKGE